MAVKAKASITISHLIDILSVTRYYLLQSSTSAAPAKPTTNPPSGWTVTEPSYTSGSTNTLYFVDCTVFTNDTFKYSEVSKSSSYEAAKEAYNKAAAVETRVTNAETQIEQNKEAISLRATKTEVTNYVQSRGENLVTNGTVMLGDNTNFSQFTYDGTEAYYSGGSFKFTGTGWERRCDELIPVDVDTTYTFSYWIKNNNAVATNYDMLMMYDIDKNQILPSHTSWTSGSTTTLVQDLNDGDTVVHLQSVSGFNKSSSSKGLIFWNYTNSKGYQYDVETYSRNVFSSLWDGTASFDSTSNTITLKAPWSHGTISAGTSVSQTISVAAYLYLNSAFTLSEANKWEKKTAMITGVGRNLQYTGGKFMEGTAFVKVGWRINLSQTPSVTTWITNVSLTQNAGVNDVNNLQTNIDDTASDLQQLVADTSKETLDSADKNREKALENYVPLDEYNTYKTTTESRLDQTSSDITAKFTTTTESIAELDGAVSSKFNELSKYIRFSSDGIEIGRNDNTLKLTLDNDMIRFERNGDTIGWWDGIDFHTGNIEIEVKEQAKFGNFAFVPRSDGSLMFLKVDNVTSSNLFNISNCEFESNIDSYTTIGSTGAIVKISQSALSSVHFTLDATKKYRISYTAKNALINGYDSSSVPWVKKFEQQGDGRHTITVTGAAECYFSALEVDEYIFRDVSIVEVS